MKHLSTLLVLAALTAGSLFGEAASIRAVRRIYLENLDPKFQEYLRLEFTRQFHGQVTVVLDRRLADAVLTGRTTRQSGAAAKTGRRLGLDDVSVGTVDLLDRQGKVVLWTERAGDRNSPFGQVGTEKVASRLVKKLKRAMR